MAPYEIRTGPVTESPPAATTPTPLPTPAYTPVPTPLAQPVIAVPPRNKADLPKELGPHIYYLVIAFPKRADLRGLILQKTGKWVPDAIPPEGLVAWLEDNLPPSPLPVNPLVTPPIPANPTTPGAAPASTATPGAVGSEAVPREPETWSIPATCMSVESGRASYSRIDSCRGEVTLTEARLAELADDAQDHVDFRRLLREEIRQVVTEDGLPVTETGQTSYDDLESDEIVNEDVDVDAPLLQRCISQFLELHPEVAQRWLEEEASDEEPEEPEEDEDQDEPDEEPEDDFDEDEPDEDDDTDEDEPEEEEEDEEPEPVTAETEAPRPPPTDVIIAR